MLDCRLLSTSYIASIGEVDGYQLVLEDCTVCAVSGVDRGLFRDRLTLALRAEPFEYQLFIGPIQMQLAGSTTPAKHIQ